MPTRNASATWNGDLKSGNGNFKGSSGALSGNYSFGTRFGDAPATNPEELIAAAHAGCFAMALCHALTQAGHPPESVATGARAHLRLVDGTPTIQRIDLTARVRAAGLGADELTALAGAAKADCAV